MGFHTGKHGKVYNDSKSIKGSGSDSPGHNDGSSEHQREYDIQLSMYGTVAERADVRVKAKNKEEAEDIALQKAEDMEIDFTNNQEAVDGWQYQVENTEEVES